jgi:hypothetical protein
LPWKSRLAEVAPDAEQDRHIMSQTSRERRNFPVPMRWPHAGSDPSQPGHRGRRTVRSLIRSKRLPICLLRTLPISPVCRSPGRILSASHPPSSSALPSNPHSARCTAGAQLPATSRLGAFWTPAATARGRVVMPASKNLHNSCSDAEWCCWIAAHRVFGYVAFNRAIFTSLV